MDKSKISKLGIRDGHNRGFGSRPSTTNENEKLNIAPRYREYMSYLPSNNQDIATATWELTNDELVKLGMDYIIAREFTADEMKQKIKDLMYPIVDHVLDGKGFSFSIPNKSLVEYNSDLCFPLLKCEKWINWDFYNGSCTHTATMTVWVLKAIYENLDSGLVLTLRDLFYRRSMLFQNQIASDGIVSDISLMFECTRSSLNLISEEKGSVCGMLRIKLKDGRTLDCSHGILFFFFLRTVHVEFMFQILARLMASLLLKNSSALLLWRKDLFLTTSSD